MNHPSFDILRRLLPIDATSFNEQAVMACMEDILSARGYAVERIQVGPAEDGRFDVLAVHQAPTVILSTHLDTVPPHLEWREDEENFYGRGSCDAAGCAAAMIAAADRLKADDLPHGLLFVVGEEVTSDGAKTAARDAAERLKETRYIINGEPTECRWVRGTLGVLAGELKAEGKAAHSAYPHRGHSATKDLIGVLHRWLTMDMPEDPDFGPTYLNVGTLEGGAAANVVAAKAASLVLARCTVPHKEVESLLTDELPANMSWEARSASDPQRLVVPPITDESIVVRFGTDVPFLSALAPCLLYGPGSIEVAHSVREFVPKAELIEASEQYEAAVRALLQMAAEG